MLPERSVDAAWKDYVAFVERQREVLLGCPWAPDPEERTAAHALLLQLQAAAWNMVIAPRTDCPALFLHAAYEPILYNYGDPSADFNYRYAFLDGRRRYRIHGRRNTSHALDFQVQAGFFGAPGASTRVASREFEELSRADDGSFEIVLGADPQPGNWLALDRGSHDNFVVIREIVADWSHEKTAELHIEDLDPGPGARPLAPDALVERLQRAKAFVGAIVAAFSTTPWTRLLAEHGVHRFSDEIFGKKTAAINPSAIYPAALYEIAPGEALIVECEIPEARYWNVELLDRWGQLTDYAHSQSSLNLRQAHLDADGNFRAVLSMEDPGVANWLDPTGRRRGVVQFRFFFFDRAVLPTMRKVPVGEVRRHLPMETPLVLPAQRKAALAERRRAAMARYGY